MSELDNAMRALNKKFGEGSVAMGKGAFLCINRHTSGIFALDFAIGGGIPEGKIIEIYGELSSFKTRIALSAVAEVQKRGGKAAWIDAENSFDRVWATKCGVQVDDLILSVPESLEMAIDTIDTLVRTRELDLLVFDSIAAAPPAKEIETSADQHQMGIAAKQFNRMCRKLMHDLRPLNLQDETTYNKCAIILINQIREKIGVLWGDPETTPGGRGIGFFAHIRIRTRGSEWIKDGDEVMGRVVKFRVTKNKTAPPLTVGQFDAYKDARIDNEKAIINESIKRGIVKRTNAKGEVKEPNEEGRVKNAGNFYSYGKLKLIKGKTNFIDLLKDKKLLPKVQKELLDATNK